MQKVNASPYLRHSAPHAIGGQMSMTLRNKQFKKHHPRHLGRVTLRAVPKLYGKPRYDNVKVILGATGDTTHMYFGRYVWNHIRFKCSIEMFWITFSSNVVLKCLRMIKVRGVLQEQQWRAFCTLTVVHGNWYIPSRTSTHVTTLTLSGPFPHEILRCPTRELYSEWRPPRSPWQRALGTHVTTRARRVRVHEYGLNTTNAFTPFQLLMYP